ncbi:hypothetical protein [Amnibacterium sp.]|uniref:hypothetical protein n=1 Tax=Amnibacterium sp. TaxID=1872496 RepID=UPI002606A80F|nr:hypothetical protein [Amnibacterium sp.]MCU1473937.1 hypothetical protein [Amnibacterium sp.]
MRPRRRRARDDDRVFLVEDPETGGIAMVRVAAADVPAFEASLQPVGQAEEDGPVVSDGSPDEPPTP